MFFLLELESVISAQKYPWPYYIGLCPMANDIFTACLGMGQICLLFRHAHVTKDCYSTIHTLITYLVLERFERFETFF